MGPKISYGASLNPNRMSDTAVAAANESFITAGHYTYPPTNTPVDLAGPVAAALASTRAYDPSGTATVLANVTAAPSPNLQTRFEVTSESSTAAAQRLHAEGSHPTVLNYASATRPGGGYLGGARAQEEDLCRSSALHTLLAAPVCRSFYTGHRRPTRDARYSHSIIWTPGVPVYRDASTCALLAHPYPTSFITAAAPNAGALARNNPAALPCTPLLEQRAARILAVAARHGARALVLGAWGCGVFRNAPDDVARIFYRLLKAGGRFEGRFERVTFAVYDNSGTGPALRAFVDAFPVGPGVVHRIPSAAGGGGGGGSASARPSGGGTGPSGSPGNNNSTGHGGGGHGPANSSQPPSNTTSSPFPGTGHTLGSATTSGSSGGRNGDPPPAAGSTQPRRSSSPIASSSSQRGVPGAPPKPSPRGGKSSQASPRPNGTLDAWLGRK